MNVDRVKESLSRWDELSPLSDEQLKSVLILSQLNLQFDDDDGSGGEKDEQQQQKEARKQGGGDLPKPPPTGAHPLHDEINEILYNLDLTDIVDTNQVGSGGGVERYLHTLQRNSARCGQLGDAVQAAYKHLALLVDNYELVSKKTKSLHVACEQLLSDQNKLVNASYLLNNRLSYFTDLEVFMQKLNSPTIENNCEYIIPMLTRIDECISYFDTNTSYKESAQYLQMALQVLRKSLSIIKTYTINSLVGVTNQIMASIQQSAASAAADGLKFSADNSYTMFYSKFRLNSTRIRTLMEQLEQRVETNISNTAAASMMYASSALALALASTTTSTTATATNGVHTAALDYEQTLADCHRCYIQQRKMFITQPVHVAIAELVAKHQRDTCSMVRSSCSFMIHLCQDEIQLYKNYFSKNSIFFEKFLEELCTILYDKLRPIIIHVVHIETLAELCSILKSEILSTSTEQLADTAASSTTTTRTAFEGVCGQMLEDVQERLVYRTHIYIQTEILNYAPSPGDLAYPEKLEIMEQIAIEQEQKLLQQQQQMKRSESTSSGELSIMSMSMTAETSSLGGESLDESATTTSSRRHRLISPQDQHGMWYPTLRRTLICLSKLYRCLDKKIFEGLAQETLNMCVQSLEKASEAIKKNKSQNDGELFLIKHLLILREQIAPFNNEFSVVEVQLDFSRIKEAAFGLMSKKTKLFKLNRDNAFMDFLLNGTLEAKENLIDSKREVDNHLKKSCEAFIDNVSSELYGPIKALLKQCQTFIQLNSSEQKADLKQQPFAKPDKLHDLFAENYKDVRKKLAKINHSMALYLSNKDIEQIIMKRVKNSMQQTYMEIAQIIAKNYTDEEQLIIACPTSEQISLWLTFS